MLKNELNELLNELLNQMEDIYRKYNLHDYTFYIVWDSNGYTIESHKNIKYSDIFPGKYLELCEELMILSVQAKKLYQNGIIKKYDEEYLFELQESFL